MGRSYCRLCEVQVSRPRRHLETARHERNLQNFVRHVALTAEVDRLREERDAYQAVAVTMAEERVPRKRIGMVRLEAARDFVEALKDVAIKRGVGGA